LLDFLYTLISDKIKGPKFLVVHIRWI